MGRSEASDDGPPDSEDEVQHSPKSKYQHRKQQVKEDSEEDDEGSEEANSSDEESGSESGDEEDIGKVKDLEARLESMENTARETNKENGDAIVRLKVKLRTMEKRMQELEDLLTKSTSKGKKRKGEDSKDSRKGKEKRIKHSPRKKSLKKRKTGGEEKQRKVKKMKRSSDDDNDDDASSSDDEDDQPKQLQFAGVGAALPRFVEKIGAKKGVTAIINAVLQHVGMDYKVEESQQLRRKRVDVRYYLKDVVCYEELQGSIKSAYRVRRSDWKWGK